MEFTLKINTDNDAFLPAPHDELVRLLRAVIRDLERGNTFGTSRDRNGNNVGSWGLANQ